MRAEAKMAIVSHDLETLSQREFSMTSLSEAVESAYRVFSRYGIGKNLVVCHCSVCMTESIEAELVATPLRRIPAATLAEYTNSAHGYDTGRIADEFRYFLPRYFDLIAGGDPPCSMGLDICLCRLGDADYRTMWPRDEAAAIDSFFDAFLRACLQFPTTALHPFGSAVGFAIIDVMTMIVTAKGDVERCLQIWDDASDPAAAVHLATLYDDLFAIRGGPALHSPYFDRFADEACRIGRWLLLPRQKQRIDAATQLTDDPETQRILRAARDHQAWQRFA